MGFERVTGNFTAELSRHNSLKDIRHDDLWRDFIDKVKMLAGNPKYREILLEVNASGNDDHDEPLSD